jgi:hypothetical protein
MFLTLVGPDAIYRQTDLGDRCSLGCVTQIGVTGEVPIRNTELRFAIDS